MSDRPSAVNGKRNRAWGTLGDCPACGQCLCFGCHPAGPCVDDLAHGEPPADSGILAGFTAAVSAGVLAGSWLAGAAPGATGGAGLRERLAAPASGHPR
jgi:hypothetical protein